MDSQRRIAVGAVGGYLLGRRRKARWLLPLAAVVAGRQLANSPGGGGSPELAKVSQAVREATVAILGPRMESLTQRIHERTEKLRASMGDQPEPGPEDRPETRPAAEAEDRPQERPHTRSEDRPQDRSEPEAAPEGDPSPAPPGRRVPITGRPGLGRGQRGDER